MVAAIHRDGDPKALMLKTDRLVLRSLCPDDAPAVRQLCDNLLVARMTSRIPHPYPDGLAEDWIAGQAKSRRRGEVFNFAIDPGAGLIGVIGLERRDDPWFELGYWLGEPWWGRGLATEAAACVIAFAFEELDQEALVAGHFLDNPASGKVLMKCGFRATGETEGWSEARGGTTPMRRFLLRRDEDWIGAAG